MNIRLLSNKDDLDRCIEIIDSLQDWFDDEDKKDIVFSLQKLPTYLYISNDKIIGFICINLNLLEYQHACYTVPYHIWLSLPN